MNENFWVYCVSQDIYEVGVVEAGKQVLMYPLHDAEPKDTWSFPEYAHGISSLHIDVHGEHPLVHIAVLE